MESSISFQVFAACIVGLVFLYSLWIGIGKKNLKGTESKHPPEPAGGLPLIGHLHLLGGDKPLFRVLGAMADKLGPVFMLRLGVNRVLVVSTGEAAKDCFTTNDQALATRPRYAAGKYLGYDYTLFGFSPYGPYWREVRKIATLELLSNRQLELMKHVRVAEIDSFVKELYSSWAENGKRPIQVEMKQKLQDLSFNIVVMMIAGKRYFGKKVTGEEKEARQFQNAMVELQYLTGTLVLSDSLPFLEWMDLGGHIKAMKKTAKELDSIMMSWLEEHRRMRACGEVEGKEDFMHVLLSTLKRSDHLDIDGVVKTLSLTFMLAGTDSTSVTLTWTLSLLLNNPHVLKKAQDELDTRVGKDRNVDESDVKDLVYLQAIIKETMRLYPAGPLATPHVAMEDCRVNDHHVPAGTWVMPNIWKLQRDPRVWSDPEEFRPERFLTTHASVDFRGQHFEYIPFGSGRRSCPGISFATQVMHLALARLLHGFDVVSPSGELVDMSEGLGLTMPKKTPLQVLFEPRLSPKLYDQL